MLSRLGDSQIILSQIILHVTFNLLVIMLMGRFAPYCLLRLDSYSILGCRSAKRGTEKRFVPNTKTAMKHSCEFQRLFLSAFSPKSKRRM